MPRISSFYGIVIAMYYREHGPPHFHALYGEHEATISIPDIEVLRGGLPPRALRLVKRWAAPFPSIVAMEAIVHATQVRWLGGHRLLLEFDDGSSGEIDFSQEQWSGVFAPLSDPDYFRQVRLDRELGTIVWPNGADLAPETLHRLATD